MAIAYGYGIATLGSAGEVLDVWFPEPRLAEGEKPEEAASALKAAGPPKEMARLLRRQDTALSEARGVRQDTVFTRVDTDAVPENAADAYLRLHALSHRLVQPNTINLDGIFGFLANVVWTNFGPCLVAGFEKTRFALRHWGPVRVLSVDKFPRMVDYVVPSDVRIADADRVRLGAYLAPGTTVMHEGFVNFNAGTLGTSMVEGRISTGVVVGAGSDIGGGASIMGTLSGGGRERITIGERVLLGANSGVGISVGDDGVVEAGLYVTAGTRIRLHTENEAARSVKAVELSGMPGLLFRRNSQTGEVEALPRQNRKVALNQQLHDN